MKYLFLLTGTLFLISGCTSSVIEYRPITQVPSSMPTPAQEEKETPVKPTKIHTLKEVQDNNFNPEYMYPETPKNTSEKPVSQKDDSLSSPTSAPSIEKEECIAMIGQEKFDKYTQMLGGEAGAIKRCIMLKTMQ